MFKGKKNESNAAGTPSTSANSGSNLINAGTKIEGEVSSNGDIRIDGIVVGNIDCKGKLILGPEGRVEGNLTCQNAVIEGSFTGNLECLELLHVKETAKINGDIVTDKLVVQSGAVYNVTCKMGVKSVKSIADQKAVAS